MMKVINTYKLSVQRVTQQQYNWSTSEEARASSCSSV